MNLTGAEDQQYAKLPELPSAPPYPCPFLTDEEIVTYLVPLYSRGWSVQPSDPGPKKKPAPELVKQFVVSGPEALEALHRHIGDITQSENHHAELTTTTAPMSLVVKVHTHSGLRPASQPDEPRRARVQPGITLRDVRFAYLLEERFEAYMSREGGTGASAVSSATGSEGQPRTARDLEARRYV
ncbi:hypothetical protein OH77DRAFT_1419322 [Trametes cingulata]|nr:hypothetical protein OH77DRAFT_1419322 [Trametes cingulata]